MRSCRLQTTCKDALKKLQETLEEGVKVEEIEDVRLCMVPWQMPLIAKMDASLGTLKKCKHLRLSSNTIDRIGSLAGMGAHSPPRLRAPSRRRSATDLSRAPPPPSACAHVVERRAADRAPTRVPATSACAVRPLVSAESLEILSLARNQLKKIENLDAVAGTLKQLWLSYNNIIGLSGVEKLQNLEVLYLSNNKVNDIKELDRLASLPKFVELVFHGNTWHTKYLSEGHDEKEYRLEIIKRSVAPRRACSIDGGRRRACAWPSRADSETAPYTRGARSRTHPTCARAPFVSNRLPNLKVLDGVHVEDDERTEAAARG